MSNTDSRNGPGGKKQHNRTFGDVMKGIPAGKGGDREGRGERRDDKREARPEADKKQERREARRPDVVKKGPVVMRKPAPIAARPPEQPAEGVGPDAPAAEAAKPAPRPQQPPAHKPQRPPKTVFRRADHLNLPPREAESAEALATSEEAPVEDFAAMFAESEKQGGGRMARFEVGQKVSGRIVQIGGDTAFLDLGGKGEALIALSELMDSEGNLLVAIGEILDGYVLSVSGGNVIVTKALTKGAQREFLLEAREAGIPVEGTVTGQNKGGLEVDLGGIRGFCPSSQADVRFAELAQFVGQRLQFLVTEVKDRDIVLSRRALLEAEAAKKAEQTREKLFDLFIDLLAPLGDEVDVVLETSHQSQGKRHKDMH
ncbi:MAG: S1 RNA-binding domain-containing protein, partial [Myxococcales bacterium]